MKVLCIILALLTSPNRKIFKFSLSTQLQIPTLPLFKVSRCPWL